MAAPVERAQGILNPQSVTSNKICLVPVVQQVIGVAMLYKLIALLFHNMAYKGALNAQQAVAKEHDDRIAPLMKNLAKHMADVTEYEGQLALFQVEQHKEPVRNLIKRSQTAAQEEQNKIDLAQTAKNQALAPHNQIVAARKGVCDVDKEYLAFAVSRIAPVYGTYVSWKQLDSLPKAAPAA